MLFGKKKKIEERALTPEEKKAKIAAVVKALKEAEARKEAAAKNEADAKKSEPKKEEKHDAPKRDGFFKKLFAKKPKQAAEPRPAQTKEESKPIPIKAEPKKKETPEPAAKDIAPKQLVKKEPFLKRLFSRNKSKTPKPAAPEDPFHNIHGGKTSMTRHLSKELTRIRKEKQKKQRSKKELLTFRGFTRALQLSSVLGKAGLEDTDPKKINKQILTSSIILLALASIFLLFKGILMGASILLLILYILLVWVMFFIPCFGLLWFLYFFYLDMRIFNRTNEVEKVFPDFLQLASSNISAGMPIDRALWYAVRPNFGILAKEIETVAKNTIAGQDLSEALSDFAQKYDSKTIQRSINLLLEGLAAGGELAELLNKISLNIEETRILKRDMAANVTTYVIFITFASVVAAPALLGLSTQLLEIIGRVMSNIATEAPNSGGGMFSFNISGDGVSVGNFRIFAYTTLTITSISAACIVNIIQKGRVKEGLNKIPMFIGISLFIYFASSALMAYFFQGLI